MSAETLLFVDWGTTNRRAWLVGPGGRVLEEHADARGILSVEPGGWDAAVAELRHVFEDVEPRLTLMTGMVGSNRGWADVGYVPCPAGIGDLVAKLHWVEADAVAIVPGVCLREPPRADVMRGEEVQVLGAVAAGLLPPDGLVCHPGTHTKWIEVADGRIVGFRTVMTGELYALLSKHSILSDLLAGEAADGPAFREGVEHGLGNCDLTAELFQIRARVLLGEAAREDAASYASGLLIGADLRAGLGRTRHDVVHVVGRPDLTALYAAALDQTGRRAERLDGDRAVLAGLQRLAETVL
ncbi:MAG: 2-dehydro-3-deoxygalactonokinase [Alphaproteobacteria bacterium]|nr:2-dehydro-3-deoxygalactonokinase [Alphaproteobacteria bacterium]